MADTLILNITTGTMTRGVPDAVSGPIRHVLLIVYYTFSFECICIIWELHRGISFIYTALI